MTVSKQIIEVLDALCEKFGIVIDWASENILPQLQELVRKFIVYKIVEDSIGIFLGAIILAISIFLIVKPIKPYIEAFNTKKENFFWGFYYGGDMSMKGSTIAMLVIGSFLIVFGLPCFIINIFDLVKDICVPELVVIEYIKSAIA